MYLYEAFSMTIKVELVPIAEGNRITIDINEKVIIGRGSSLGVGVVKKKRLIEG